MSTEDTVLEKLSSSQEAEHLQGGQAKQLTLLNETLLGLHKEVRNQKASRCIESM